MRVHMEDEEFTEEELASLKEFVDMVNNGELDTQMSCWGNHSDYSHGY